MELLLWLGILWVIYSIYQSTKLKKRQLPMPSTSHRSPQPPARSKSTVEINDDFRRAIAAIAAGDSHVFVTGRAGTGKSTLLRHLTETCGRKLAIVAPTGLAAINVGGQTIHSLFKLPPRFIDVKEIRPRRNAGVLKALQMLVVDEVSMVRADLMDGIDTALRVNRRSNQPFGGIQVVMFGDLWQLPPIVRESELREYFEKNYGGSYFFHGHAWRQTRTTSIELGKVYRQKDDAEFLGILQAVREGLNLGEALKILNGRVRNLDSRPDADSYVALTGTNDAAFQINSTKLNALAGKEKTYQCKVTGKFDENAFPTDADLTLKIGAKVMFLKNDSARRWVNGSWGFVSALGESSVEVRLSDGQGHRVEPMIWENISYNYDRATNQITRDVIGSFTQLPLRLGWAITIHKSQGQTFDKVHIDLGSGAFAHGQTYVALSRCRTLAGVSLGRPIQHRDIIVDPLVNDFKKVFPTV